MHWITGKVPASALREMAHASSSTENDSESNVKFDTALFWEVPWKHWLGMPEAFHWSYEGEKIPESVLRQLVGQKIEAGIRFTHEGIECYATAICLPENDLGKVITKAHLPEIAFLIGVDVSLIDMDS